MTNIDRSENNVVSFRPAKPSAEGWGPREQEALLLARLAAMPQLEYERARLATARELKCRVSWLDRKIESIRCLAEEYQHRRPPNSAMPSTFVHQDGSEIVGFVTAAAHRQGSDTILLILSDGNGTVVRSSPIRKERPAELKPRLAESEPA